MNGEDNLYAKVFSTVNLAGDKIITFSFNKTVYSVNNTIGNVVWLKIVRDLHILSGYFSADGLTWTQIGSSIGVTTLDSYNTNYNGWCGNRQGLYVKGTVTIPADFDLYIYRDAYTPIKASCPANQFGTTVTTLTAGQVLYNIHNNDWALYAGVEFGTDNYNKTSDSIQFSASCTVGGTIEVWLDSINTGQKIASCDITSTGSSSTFKNFTAKSIETTGRHDVYLKFTGTGTSILYYLKTITFIAKDKNTGIITPNADADNFKIFPNPAGKKIRIESKTSFDKFEVYNLSGELMFSKSENGLTKSATYQLSLPLGTYLAKIVNKDDFKTTKLIIK